MMLFLFLLRERLTLSNVFADLDMPLLKQKLAWTLAPFIILALIFCSRISSTLYISEYEKILNFTFKAIDTNVLDL